METRKYSTRMALTSTRIPRSTRLLFIATCRSWLRLSCPTASIVLSRASRWLSAGAAACILAACSPAPRAVHFIAEGRPAKLSDWQVLSARSGSLTLNAGVVPYDLNTPLFSDYAHKLRTIWMPRGTSAKYDADGSFDFPIGTIISKTFYYPFAKGAAARDSNAVARTY